MNKHRGLALASFVLASAIQSANGQIQLAHSATFGDPTADDLFVSSAVAPNGDIAVVSQLGVYGATTNTTTLQVFTPTAIPRWSASRAQTLDGADVAFDAQGNLRVLWNAYDASGRPVTRVSRYDANGGHAWTFEYPMAANETAGGARLLVDANGTAFVAGGVAQSSATGGPTRGMALVFAVSAQGTMNWEVRSNPPPNTGDGLSLLTLDSNGDLFGCGLSRSTTTVSQYSLVLLRVTSSGTLQWRSTSPPAPGPAYYVPYDIEVSGGRVAMVGNWEPYIAPIPQIGMAWCFDSNGQMLWSRQLPNPGPGHRLSAASAEFEADGNLRVSETSLDYWVVGPESVSALVRLDANGQLLQSSAWGPSPSVFGTNGGDMLLGPAGEGWIGAGAYLQECDADLHVRSTLRLPPDPQHAWLIRRVMRSPNGDLVAVGAVADAPWIFPHDLFVAVLDISDSPQGYCTATTTSNGCLPLLTFGGTPSVSASSGFVVRANSLRNQKSAMLLYGINGALAAPFHGGTLCVNPPLARAPLLDTGGNSPPANDCSGSLSFDMNAFAVGALGGSPLAALQVAGTNVCCQFWGRDPTQAMPLQSMLTSGLRYTVLP
jgi:hypothetical protein